MNKHAENPLLSSIATMQAQLAQFAKQAHLPDAGFHELQEMYSHGMDRALGVQMNSIDAAVRLQTEMIDRCKGGYQSAYWFMPSWNLWLNSISQSLTTVMELQMNLLNIFAPSAPTLSGYRSRTNHTVEEIAHHMDLGTGARKKPSRRKPS